MQKDTIVKILSILQRQKITEGILVRLDNYYSPNWKQQKTHLSQPKTSQKLKNRKFFETFLMTVSGKPQSAENPKESSMLAKRFVCSKNRGGGLR